MFDLDPAISTTSAPSRTVQVVSGALAVATRGRRSAVAPAPDVYLMVQGTLSRYWTIPSNPQALVRGVIGSPPPRGCPIR